MRQVVRCMYCKLSDHAICVDCKYLRQMGTFLHGCMQNAGHVYVDVIPALVETGNVRMSVVSRKPRVEAWNTHSARCRSCVSITRWDPDVRHTSPYSSTGKSKRVQQ